MYLKTVYIWRRIRCTCTSKGYFHIIKVYVKHTHVIRMSCMKTCLGRLCVALKVAALIVNLFALGLPYWYKGDTAETTGVDGSNKVKTTVREGLWQKCTDMEYVSNTSSFCAGVDGTNTGNMCTSTRWRVAVTIYMSAIYTQYTVTSNIADLYITLKSGW